MTCCVLLSIYMFGLQVKNQLQDRLQELQPLPEMLKNTEIRLHESEDQLRNSERKNAENSRIISDLSLKVSGSGKKSHIKVNSEYSKHNNLHQNKFTPK